MKFVKFAKKEENLMIILPFLLFLTSKKKKKKKSVRIQFQIYNILTKLSNISIYGKYL